MTHQKEIADRIAQLRRERSARERRDVLQEEIAEAVQLTPVTYSRYEKGRRKVPEEVIQALAEYYGVTAWFIRYGVDAPRVDAASGLGPTRLSDAEIAEARRIRDAEQASSSGAATDLPLPKRRRGGQ